MNVDYKETSRIQLSAIDSANEYIYQAIKVLKSQPKSSLSIIADFGLVQGSNWMHVMKTIIQYLKERNKIKDENEILIIHSDRLTNE
ncbi:hypothetical protein I4U23_003601 [Adineta vaga]|nr:hypothetical protein I4U23_003601 [Adineta vaga]